MNNRFTALGLSLLLLLSGSSVVLAGGRNENHGRPGQEQKGGNNRGNHGRPGNNNGNKNHGGQKPGGNFGKGNKDHGQKPGGSYGNGNKGNHGGQKPGGGHWDNGRPGNHGGNSAPRPGGYNRPTPPPPAPPRSYGRPGAHRPHPRVAPAGYVYPDRLGFMVRNATVGANNIMLWEVEPGTFLLQYTRGGVDYMRYIYPTLNRYGSVQVLTPGWQPYSSWLSIPSFQINLWL